MSLCQLVAFCPCLLDRPIRLIRGFAPYRRANLSCGEIREREGQDSYAGLAGSVRSLAEGRSAARERVRRAPVANSGNILPCGLIAQAPHSQAVTPERKHQSERYPRPPNPPPYSPHSSRVRAACSDQLRAVPQAKPPQWGGFRQEGHKRYARWPRRESRAWGSRVQPWSGGRSVRVRAYCAFDHN